MTSDPAELFAERARFVPGSAIAWGVLRNGETLIGCTDPAFADAAFPIASITKTMTATLLALFVQRASLALDTRIGDLTGTALAPAVAKITLCELATHSSGLPRVPPGMLENIPDISNPYLSFGDDELFGYLEKIMEGNIVDGLGMFEYSNFGFAILGILLARAAGCSYATLIERDVFAPLGMRDSFVNIAAPRGTRNDIERPIVPGMDADGVPAVAWQFAAFAPAGGVVSTTADMLRYAASLLDGTTELGAAQRAATVPRGAAKAGASIGLGWMIHGDVRWHNGGLGGHHSMLAIDLDAKRAAVALWNTSASLDDIGMHLVDASSPVIPREAEVLLPLAERERLCGTYDVEGGGTLTVAIDGPRLVIDGVRGTDDKRSRLYARADGAFFSKLMPDTIFRFDRDDDGTYRVEQRAIGTFTILRATRQR